MFTNPRPGSRGSTRIPRSLANLFPGPSDRIRTLQIFVRRIPRTLTTNTTPSDYTTPDTITDPIVILRMRLTPRPTVP